MSDTTLSKIERGMADAIEGMTQGDGYNFDWGSVNQPDEALQVFPSAEITLEEEKCLDDEGGVWADAYEIESSFVIRVRASIANETERPAYEINTELNLALSDLKKLFGTNYHVSDSCDLIMYTGCQRVADARNDIFRPSHMDVRFTVRYTQDRQTPETSAE
jgi:hypothetical protein